MKIKSKIIVFTSILFTSTPFLVECQTITLNNGMILHPSYQSNSVIKLGRDSAAGGSIVWLSDSSNSNIVNNWDLGRQIQMNTRDLNGDYNPTQAGDGPNASGSIIFFPDTFVTFSKCQPLKFYNLPPYSGPPRPAMGELFYMWTEFLPNSNGKAFLVKTFFHNTDPLLGECFANVVSPGDYLNHTSFTGLKVYNGKYPWTMDTISTLIDPWDGSVTTRFSSTERWFSFTDNLGYGLSHLGDYSYGDLLFFNTPGMECKAANTLERFALRVEPNDTMQQREGWGIYYVGNVNEARNFFEQYKPRKSGNYQDNFNDTRLLNWDRNNNPIIVQNGALKMGLDNSWVNDISLVNKFYSDATFSVDIKHQSGNSWYGLAIRKTGMGHFWENGSGFYLIYLTSNGNLVLYSPLDGTLASSTVPGYISSNWNNLSVSVIGYSFVIKVNNITYITYNDVNQRFQDGYVSLVNDKNIVWFDNFSVNSTGDSVAPANVTAALITSHADTVQLSWSNPNTPDWRWTRILRKEGVHSNHWRDGMLAYEGKLSSYKDVDIEAGKTYCYTIFTCDHAGNYSTGYSLPCYILGVEKPIDDNINIINYPNPFISATTIKWKSQTSGNTRLAIYDVFGRIITTIVDEFKPQGEYNVQFESNDLPSGIFFYQLKVGNFVSTKKMMIMK
jgi:hypothetical protein